MQSGWISSDIFQMSTTIIMSITLKKISHPIDWQQDLGQKRGEDGDAIRMDCFWHPTPAFKQPLADFKYGPKKKMTNDPHGVNSGADAMALPCTMIQK